MLGRFGARDPIGYRDSQQLYEYQHGSALSLLDANGLDSAGCDCVGNFKIPQQQCGQAELGKTFVDKAQQQGKCKGELCDGTCTVSSVTWKCDAETTPDGGNLIKWVQTKETHKGCQKAIQPC